MASIDLKIAMIQDQPGSGVRDKFRDVLIRRKPDIIVFPEYYFVKPEEGNVISSAWRLESIINEIRNWSFQFDCLIVAGSMTTESQGRLYNRSNLIYKGDIFGYYDKIHPYRNEGRGLIQKGVEYKVFDIFNLRIGLLICADVLYPDTFRNMAGLKPDIIFVPTTSPYRPNESAKIKFERDRQLFVRGAEISGATIVKVCASGKIGDKRFQARSLIAAPKGIAWRNPPTDEDKSKLIFARLRKTEGDTRLDTDVILP